MRDVDEASFDAEVLHGAVVVDFWAPWCGPCKAVERSLEELQRESAGRLDFVKVDIEANPGLANRYDVLSLPTVMLFVDGERRETVFGARSKKHFEKTLARHF
jgi:thioredoxin 1